MNRTNPSRREFLRLASATATGALLVSCVPSAAPEAPAGEALPAEEITEINIFGWGTPVVEPFHARYTEETGVRVNYEPFPARWDEVLNKFTLWGETGYDGVDVLWADDLIAGQWTTNGWALDLSDTASLLRDEEDLVGGIRRLNEAVGMVGRIFFWLGVMPFWHNKDMVAEPPKTWDELVTVAMEHTKPEENIWGWRPLPQWNTTLLMCNQAGANTETMDDEATLTALQVMYDWVHEHKITPPSIVSESEGDVVSLAANGETAMWGIVSDFSYRALLNVEGGVLNEENLVPTRWPKGPVNDTGLLHGWGWMVPNALSPERREAATDYLMWQARDDILKEFSIAIELAPPRKSMFDDPDIVEAIPMLAAGPGWAEQVRDSNLRTPPIISPHMTELHQIYENVCQFLFSGEMSPEEAQAWAVNEIKLVGA